MTCWRRLRDWNEAGVWRRLHELLLSELRAADMLGFSSAAVDSSHIRAMNGGPATGPSPVDGGKSGSKHRLSVEAYGIPLVAITNGGTRNDVSRLIPLIQAVPSCAAAAGGRRGFKRPGMWRGRLFQASGSDRRTHTPRPHHSPAAVAADHALAVARNITASYLATDTVTAAARINTVLGRPTDIPHLPVRLAWAAVHLTASPDTVQGTISQQRHRHEEEQRRTEHNHRLEQAQTMRDTLMSDPSLALSYWFAIAPETVDTHTLDRLEELLVKTAVYAPQGQWAPLARLLHTFTLGLTNEAKNHLVDTLAAVIDRYGHPGIAAAVQALRQAPEARARGRRPTELSGRAAGVLYADHAKPARRSRSW
ncbi:hypothetical protein [Streptomyces sp. NPDC006739]|uniref:hypothetical protein n=1 Tax=Streptomyces sp. NPDC006739 TaxID=3364763 RepID=UPI0036881636